MTSSLVGSEMCIRDRLQILQNAGWQAQLEQLVQVKVRPVAVRRADVIAAVSYTHLTLPTICSV
eukprot:5754814-Prorocentrum_lima.AAC.1